jgi:excisionase family DNA binding protein
VIPPPTDTLPNREYLSVGEAVAHTGVSQRAILSGALPTYMAGGQWRIPTAAVRAYLEWQRDGLPVR